MVQNLSASLAATQSFEQEIQRAEELRALDRAKTTFFQNVSHVSVSLTSSLSIHHTFIANGFTMESCYLTICTNRNFVHL